MSAGFTCPRSTIRKYGADGRLSGFEPTVPEAVAARAQGGRQRRPTLSIRRRPASSRPKPSSDRAFWSRSSAAARTCAASAGPATTTCRFERFPPTGFFELAEDARAHASRVGLVSIALCDHPEIERILARLHEMGYAISPASLRLDDLTEPIVRVLQRERRARNHDCSRNRVRPAAARDQQDGDQRRDSRPGRADLRQRHREPEALLHDRPPHGNRRGPGRHPRSDAADARPDAQARAIARGTSGESSAA